MTPSSRPKRVLQLQTDVGVSGGIASYIGELVRSPVMNIHSFVVTAVNPAANSEAIRRLYGEKPAISEMPASYSLWSLPSYVRQLRALLRLHRIDIVHAHAVRAALAAAIAALLDGVPLVYTNHGLRYTQKTSAMGKMVFTIMEWFVCRVATKICAIRRFDHSILLNSPLGRTRGLCLVETRIHAPPPVCAQDLVLNQAMQHRESRPWRVVGIGSLIDVKRPDRFLNWVKALRDSQLDISAIWIGDGPLRGAMEQRAQALNLPVTFLGHQPREQVFRILGTAHLLFLTSQFEVFPLAVLEAYSQGVPVVSSRFAGAEDFIDSGRTGLLVDADKPDGVAQCVSALLHDAGHLTGMRRTVRTEFERRFSDPDLMALAYSKIYSDTAESYILQEQA